MGKIIKEYICTCDRCGREIKHHTYENEVRFNNAEYVFCESCYKDLLAFFDLWKSINLNIINKIPNETN